MQKRWWCFSIYLYQQKHTFRFCKAPSDSEPFNFCPTTCFFGDNLLADVRVAMALRFNDSLSVMWPFPWPPVFPLLP